MDDSLTLTILAIVALLFLSGFFSGSETALTAASKARMQRLARDGRTRALRVAKLMEDPEALLGGILLGNNLVNILASALATSVLLEIFGPDGVVWATLIMTAAILVFSEVLPKTYAISNPDRVALAVAPFIHLVIRLLSPLVAVVRKMVRGILYLFGVDTTNADHVLSAHEEIRTTIHYQESEGSLLKDSRDMLGGILDLDSVTVEDVMVHRKNMVMVNIDLKPASVLSRVVESPFTRIPLWRRNKENVVGVLHAKDVLRSLARKGGDFSKLRIERLMKKPWFVPESSTLREQLNAFLSEGRHFALVVDEYGALMGMITLEDILEEIVGDITDEHDFEAEGVKCLDTGAIIVEGTVTMRDLNRQFDWSLPDDDATTIAGLIINEAGKLPIVGDTFNFFGFKFQILGRQKNQITKIKITRRTATPKHEATA